MKYRLVLLSVLLSVGMSFSSSAEVVDKPVSKFDIQRRPTRTVYDVGEPVDLSGIEVKVTFLDGETEMAYAEDFTVESYNANTEGSQLIVLRYGRYPTQLDVTVKKAVVTRFEARVSSKTRYIGETVPKDDFTVKVYYDNGKQEEVTDFTLTSTYLSERYNPVTLSWRDQTEKFEISAVQNYCRSLNLISKGKEDFMLGELFTTEGLKVEGTFVNGDSRDVTTEVAIEEPDMTTPGSKRVRLTFDNTSVDYQVVVTKYDFDYADISEYEESGVAYLYFKRKEEPVAVVDTIWHTDDFQAGVRTYVIRFNDKTYEAEGPIPEEDMRFVGSMRVRAQVPVGVNIVSDDVGTLGYVRKTELQNLGDSVVTVHVEIPDPLDYLYGVPQTLQLNKGGRTLFALDVKNEKVYDIATSFFRPFKIRLEVPNG